MTEKGRRFYLPTRVQFPSEKRGEILDYLKAAESNLVPAIRDSREGTKAALTALTKLFTWYRLASDDEQGAKGRGAILLSVLADLPAWAIVMAVDQWLGGSAGDHDYRFMPAPAILRSIALNLLAPHRSQAEKIKQLLAAEQDRPVEPTEGERERIAAGFKELSATLGALNAVEKAEAEDRQRQKSKETNQRFFEDDCRESGVDPGRGYSPSLERIVRIQIKNRDGGESTHRVLFSSEGS